MKRFFGGKINRSLSPFPNERAFVFKNWKEYTIVSPWRTRRTRPSRYLFRFFARFSFATLPVPSRPVPGFVSNPKSWLQFCPSGVYEPLQLEISVIRCNLSHRCTGGKVFEASQFFLMPE